MSLFGRQRREFFGITGAQDLIPHRSAPVTTGTVTVTSDTAMRHSAVWACIRLRANLISTLPLDVFRMVDKMQVEWPKPPVLIAPGGESWDYVDWMNASQRDLDRAGNVVGLITERNSFNLPSRIDLAGLSEWTVREMKDQGIKYRIRNTDYDPDQVWHERQNPVAGTAIGLSPVAYAAWTIGQYESARQFALEWYSSGGIPKALMRNKARTVPEPDAQRMKAQFKAAVMGRDVFVVGNDWEYDPVQAEAVSMEWLENQKFSAAEIARFFDCPADLIDAAVATGNITYANVTQRNLQFLIMHLGPAITLREKNLTKLLPVPRYVKLNRDALLAMDPQMRTNVLAARITSRQLAPSEARALENLPPFTEAQMAEFDRFWPPKPATPTAAPAPAKVAG